MDTKQQQETTIAITAIIFIILGFILGFLIGMPTNKERARMNENQETKFCLQISKNPGSVSNDIIATCILDLQKQK